MRVGIIFVLLFLSFSQYGQAAQFLFFERTVTFKGDMHPTETDYCFRSGFNPEPGVPLNWITPVNYYQGSYFLEAKVAEMTPTSNNISLGIGWRPYSPQQDPDVLHNHIYPLGIRKTGTYTDTKGLANMWYGTARGPDRGYADWDWAHAWDKIYSYIKPNGQNPWPVKVQFKLYIISKGAAFKAPSQTVAVPQVFPTGGTLSAPTYIFISCATSGARTNYSFHNTDPSSATPFYEGPFKITTSTVLNVKAFKDGYNSSPVSTITYTINNTDTQPPTVTSATAVNNTTIRVTFSEYVHDKASPRVSNFSINYGVTISAVTLLTTDMKTIELTTSPLSGTDYTITINGVRDLSANYITANTTVSLGNQTTIDDRSITVPDRYMNTKGQWYDMLGSLWSGTKATGELSRDIPAGIYLQKTMNQGRRSFKKIIRY